MMGFAPLNPSYGGLRRIAMERSFKREVEALRLGAVASARTAALVDPEGEGLAQCLGDIESQSAHRVAAE